MARILTSGAEEFTANADFVNMMFDIAGAAITVDATVFHGFGAGSKSFLFPDNGSAEALTRSLVSTKTSGTLWSRHYVYFDTFGTTPNSFGTLIFWDNSGASLVKIQLNPSTRKFQVVNSVPATPITTSGSVAISSAHWYRVEMQVVIDASAGSVTVKIYDGDSTTVLDSMTQTGVQTAPATGGYTGCKFGNSSPVAWGPLHMDDVAINDETTAAADNQTSWCGPGAIVTLWPDSDVSVTWTKGGSSPASTNWGGVNNHPPDDGVTFNTTTGSTNVDQFGTTNLPTGAPSTGYNCVDVYARFGGTSTSSGTIQYAIWLQGARSEGPSPSITISLNGWKRGTSAEHFTHDLSTYVLADINGLQIGYSASTGTSVTKQVTSLWANVEYVPALATINVSRSLSGSYQALTAITKSSVVRHAALTALKSLRSTWSASLFSPLASKSSNFEAKGSITASNTAQSAFEVLQRLTQSF